MGAGFLRRYISMGKSMSFNKLEFHKFPMQYRNKQIKLAIKNNKPTKTNGCYKKWCLLCSLLAGLQCEGLQ